MKVFLLICLTFFSLNASFGLSLDLEVNEYLSKIIKITCDADDTHCIESCGNKLSCEQEEAYCSSCAGQSLSDISLYLSNVGRSLLPQKDQLDTKSEFFSDLKANTLVSLDAETSFYYFELKTEQLKANFLKACPEASVDAFAFMKLEPVTHQLESLKYLYCVNASGESSLYKF